MNAACACDAGRIILTLVFGVTDPVLWLPVIANCILTWYLDCDNAVKLKVLTAVSIMLRAGYGLYLKNCSAFVFDVLIVASNIVSIVSILKSRRKET